MSKLFTKEEIVINIDEIDVVFNLSNEDLKSDVLYPVYILFTNTKTRFSKLTKLFSGSTLNHVSVGFTEIIDKYHTFDATAGGFHTEEYAELKGALYSQYVINIPKEAYDAIKNKIQSYKDNNKKTSYNWVGLVNALAGKVIIKDKNPERKFCSQFVASLFEDIGIKLSKLPSNVVKPSELINHKLLQFVKKGKV